MANSLQLSEIIVEKTSHGNSIRYVYEDTTIEHPTIRISGISFSKATELLKRHEAKQRVSDAIAVESEKVHKMSSNSQPNSPIVLWKFLWVLLGDAQYHAVIHWTERPSHFVIQQPKELAVLWGRQKGNEKMNYEKLSRAIRFYYKATGGNGIIEKGGAKFTFRFDENKVRKLLHH